MVVLIIVFALNFCSRLPQNNVGLLAIRSSIVVVWFLFELRGIIISILTDILSVFCMVSWYRQKNSKVHANVTRKDT